MPPSGSRGRVGRWESGVHDRIGGNSRDAFRSEGAPGCRHGCSGATAKPSRWGTRGFEVGTSSSPRQGRRRLLRPCRGGLMGASRYPRVPLRPPVGELRRTRGYRPGHLRCPGYGGCHPPILSRTRIAYGGFFALTKWGLMGDPFILSQPQPRRGCCPVTLSCKLS